MFKGVTESENIQQLKESYAVYGLEHYGWPYQMLEIYNIWFYEQLETAEYLYYCRIYYASTHPDSERISFLNANFIFNITTKKWSKSHFGDDVMATEEENGLPENDGNSYILIYP